MNGMPKDIVCKYLYMSCQKLSMLKASNLPLCRHMLLIYCFNEIQYDTATCSIEAWTCTSAEIRLTLKLSFVTTLTTGTAAAAPKARYKYCKSIDPMLLY